MKRINKIIATIIILLTFTFQGCTIYEKDSSKDIVNGFLENKIITSVVTVSAGSISGMIKAEGSGVIVTYSNASNGFYYYVLTNNHVVFEQKNFKIKDCYGETYEAILYRGDYNYDLALLRFTSEKEYYVPKLLENNVEIGTPIISVGKPLGISNVITLGSVINYGEITANNDNGDDSTAENNGSEVKFNVMEHNAPTNKGSSGGPVFTYDYNICAINYASSRDDNEKFVSSYAIPASKIVEFLVKYGYMENNGDKL